METDLRIECFTLGAWQTNCYVAWIRGRVECWVIDAGFEPDPMIDFINQQRLTPSRLILTHGHLDHIAGVAAFKKKWPDLPLAIHEWETEFLTNPAMNLSYMVDMKLTAPPADVGLLNGQQLDMGSLAFHIRHTPGHSPGGISLYQPDHHVAFVGDALFAGSIGRYDFPHSDGRQLLQSIATRLLTLPDETRVLPGHGPETTIGHERRHNPYL
jgi:glyoxylase-like metal-dependent hydrolase (beta-lactamase superfamily II)